jgi:hypothetical protein
MVIRKNWETQDQSNVLRRVRLPKEQKQMSERDPLQKQEGGSHYRGYAIPPIEFIHKNELNFIQGNVIKYVMRYKEKNGLQDLEKAKHYIELLIEFEYGKKA